MASEPTFKGQRLVPKYGNKLSDFTPYKIYTVIAGEGDENLSPIAAMFGKRTHSSRTANVRDDKGVIRFVTLDFFREFRLESGVLYHD